MKKLLIPVVGAVVLGLCAGSGFSYVNAKEAALVHAVHVADSVAKHLRDSTATADSTQKADHARELEAAAEEIPMTPADSIRAAHNESTTLKAATHGVPNAVDPKSRASVPKAADSHAPAASTGHDPAPPAAKPAVKRVPAQAVPNSATETTAPGNVTERKVPEALDSALPERRISKIFASMQSKDAAKILEQMSDSDIRVILGLMGDKQAAAILSALPPSRAAVVSKGGASKNPPDHNELMPEGVHP